MFKKILLIIPVLLISCQSFAVNSQVEKFPIKDVSGTGPLPYNYRVIDGTIHAGGHPLNPAISFSNSDEQVLSILNCLKSKNIHTIIDLENTNSIQKRYQSLIDYAGMQRIHIPLNQFRVPNKGEWSQIIDTMKAPVYIHCKWGADRTGMVIARYLVEEEGYTPGEAYKAVVSGGSHSGALGGFKTSFVNFYLKRFIYNGVK